MYKRYMFVFVRSVHMHMHMQMHALVRTHVHKDMYICSHIFIKLFRLVSMDWLKACRPKQGVPPWLWQPSEPTIVLWLLWNV